MGNNFISSRKLDETDCRLLPLSKAECKMQVFRFQPIHLSCNSEIMAREWTSRRRCLAPADSSLPCNTHKGSLLLVLILVPLILNSCLHTGPLQPRLPLLGSVFGLPSFHHRSNRSYNSPVPDKHSSC